MLQRSWMAMLAALTMMGVGGAYAQQPFALLPNEEVKDGPSPDGVSLVWTKRMAGAISELSISKDGKTILVATNPDHDIEGSASQPLLTQFDSSGRMKWRLQMKSPVKEQDLSQSGKLSVISTYNNEVLGIDERGKILWSTEAMCRPKIIEYSKSILCYHDDDNEPGVAFDILDWQGKKKFSFPIEKDILALKISRNGMHTALGLAQGQVVLVGSNHQKLWTAQVEGEVVDLAVGDDAQVAVLYRAKGTPARHLISVFDSKGHALGTPFDPGFRIGQIEIDPTGKSVFYYGSGKFGQVLGSLNISDGKTLWRKGVTLSTEYAYSISTQGDRIFMGVEKEKNHSRQSHLMVFQQNGTPKWDLPLREDEGAYLYTHRAAANHLIIGTDDGRLNLYKF